MGLFNFLKSTEKDDRNLITISNERNRSMEIICSKLCCEKYEARGTYLNRLANLDPDENNIAEVKDKLQHKKEIEAILYKMNSISTPSAIYLQWTSDFELLYDFSRKKRRPIYNEMMQKNPVLLQKIRTAIKDQNYEEYGQLLKQDLEFLDLFMSYLSLNGNKGDKSFNDMDNFDF